MMENVWYKIMAIYIYLISVFCWLLMNVHPHNWHVEVTAL